MATNQGCQTKHIKGMHGQKGKQRSSRTKVPPLQRTRQRSPRKNKSSNISFFNGAQVDRKDISTKQLAANQTSTIGETQDKASRLLARPVERNVTHQINVAGEDQSDSICGLNSTISVT
eukprot:2867647-Amphidinium_carterae.1